MCIISNEFVRYVEKRWISRDGNRKISTPDREKQLNKLNPGTRNRVVTNSKPANLYIEKEKPRTDDAFRASSGTDPKPKDVEKPNLTSFDSERATPRPSIPDTSSLDPKPKIVENPKLPSSEVEKPKPRDDIQPVSSVPKVDYATQLFNMIFLEEPKENDSKLAQCMSVPSKHAEEPKENYKKVPAPPVESECAGVNPTVKQNVPSTVTNRKNKFDPGIEELMKDFNWNTQPLNCVQNNTANHFDMAKMVSPLPQQPHPFAAPQIPYPNTPYSSMYYTPMQVAPVNGMTAAGISRPPATLPPISVAASQSGVNRDFSLMPGTLTRR